jgi:adenylate kinase
MRLVLLGLPGIGKGTQAAKLAAEFGIKHVSTGDIFRDPAFRGTDLGKRVAEYAARGDLVPDDVVVGVILGRLADEDLAAGYILDGFPRTLGQAEAFDAALADSGATLDAVLFFDGDDEIVVERLTGRRTCSECNAICHALFDPPAKDGVCDSCGAKLYVREDDREETVRNRIEVYRNETRPLIDYYSGKGLLRTIDGTAGVEEVFRNTIEALERS